MDDAQQLTELEEVFDQVIFGLVADASQSAKLQRKQQASSLLIMGILHNISSLSLSRSFHMLWLRVVGQLAKDMQEGNALSEGILEQFKNAMLVMITSGVFEVISKRTSQNILEMTWAIIDSFVPKLRVEIEFVIDPKRRRKTELGPTGGPQTTITRTPESTVTIEAVPTRDLAVSATGSHTSASTTLKSSSMTLTTLTDKSGSFCSSPTFNTTSSEGTPRRGVQIVTAIQDDGKALTRAAVSETRSMTVETNVLVLPRSTVDNKRLELLRSEEEHSDARKLKRSASETRKEIFERLRGV
tara:strand:- start:1892 stop:2791 length:900 start_codon:yes stop_codon:yes gene_type:complete